MLSALALLGCPKPPPPIVVEADPELSQPLPVDPAVRMGVFENGLHWYVEVNREPQARAVLRLVADTGSVLEDDKQLGLAHFVEHMAFNGTENFPHNELVKYLESTGAQFGPHLNAHTSFDETVYKLQVPTDEPETFEKAFLVLEDWAHGLAFDAEEIEKERGVVLEEWRTRLGAGGRIQDVVVPLLFYGSPYATRLPIGTEESLKTFAPDDLQRFYKDWYRPDLMAVVAVGDFDPDKVEALIRQHFADLPPAAEPRERVRYEIPDHDDTKYAIIADPEVSRIAVQILAKHDDIEGAKVGDYRRSLLEQVAFEIVRERLAEIARRPEPPFLVASTGGQRMSPTEGADVVFAQVDEDGILAGYEALQIELRRLREHGLRAGEVERAKARVLKQYDRLLLEKDKTDSQTAAEEIVRVFTTGEAMPGTDHEVALARKYVPAFTLEELDAWAKEWMPERSRVVTVVMPKKDGLAVPSEADLAKIDVAVRTMVVDALPEDEAAGDLLAALPTPGTVTSKDEQYAADLGFQGWTLSNGVRVWFKDTDFKQDEVRFTAFSPGGESLLADADVVSGRLSSDVVDRSGLGQLDANGLVRWMSGKTLSVQPGWNETWETLSGSASPADLESAFQVMYASVTAPRFTEEGWKLAIDTSTSNLRNRLLDPNAHFYDAYTGLLWPDDVRRKPWTVETLAQGSLDRAKAVYTDRFGDLGDATFVFVGNLPDDFEAQVTKYLAALPTAKRAESWKDRGQPPKGGVLETKVEKGIDPKARVRYEWHGAFPENTWDTRNQLHSMADIFEVQLREKLREDMGGVYGVSVNSNETYAPTNRYSIIVDFQCDPGRAEDLAAAVLSTAAALKKDGPPASYVTDEQEKNRRDREESLRTNGFWLSAFAGTLQRGADPKEILTWDARNDALSPTLVRDAARKWLDDKNRAKVVLMPQPAATPAPTPAP